MKIALLTDGIYPDFVGGIQKHSTYLAKHLAKKGVVVDLYLRNSADHSFGGISLFEGEELDRVRFLTVPFRPVGYFPGHYLWQLYEYSSSIFARLRVEEEVDFIYAQGFSGWRLLKEKAKGFRCGPVGVHFHGYDMFQKAPSVKAKLQQLMLRPFVVHNLKAADAVFSLGGRLDGIIGSVGVSKERIFYSPNGVEASWLAPEVGVGRRPRRLLFVGRYARLKGIEELTAVLKRFLAEGVEFEFDFIGPIPEELCTAASNIRYWGLLKDTGRMQEIFRGCDVLVCPSYAEGMPTVIMEAMASGLAIVATDVGAVNSMVSSKNGWLIPPGDEEALGGALGDALMISEEALLNKKQCSLHRAGEFFLWEAVAERTLEEIEAIVEKHV